MEKLPAALISNGIEIRQEETGAIFDRAMANYRSIVELTKSLESDYARELSRPVGEADHKLLLALETSLQEIRSIELKLDTLASDTLRMLEELGSQRQALEARLARPPR